MERTGVIVIAIALFLLVTFLYWKLTYGLVKKEYSKKMRRQWGTRMFYWTGALFFSGGITVLVIILLKGVIF